MNQLFIKMKRVDDSLERLLETVRGRGCEVLEMTARRSLDQSFFFIRLSLQGNGTVKHLKKDLAAMESIRDVEIEETEAVNSLFH